MATKSEESRPAAAERQPVDEVTIRIAGDSGDGIQLTGTQLTVSSASAGNDLATLPDYPAEIRAPAGTLPGVSGFQIHFSSHEILTPGDKADVLVAFNPAALKVNLPDLKPGGILIVNRNAFDENALKKAGYESNPLEDGSLQGWRVYAVEITKLTREALKDSGLTFREQDRCKNFFALGMIYWLYSRPLEPTIRWINEKFRARPELARANEKVLRAGYNYADIARIFQTVYEVPPAKLAPGTYRHVDGNEAVALAMATVAQTTGVPVFLGSYPITPASSILHQASKLRAFGVTTFQAEDEIAGIGSSVGAAFAGNIAYTTTSGPGLSLKSEIVGLAVILELPLVIVDVQRGGPSTGLPTKTEQADLLQAMWGRHGEAPLPVLAATSPGDCFWMTLEATRIAVKYMTPVLLLTEGYLANGAEPWRVPSLDELPRIEVKYFDDPAQFKGAYHRDPETLARPWIRPGTPGLEHRVGGLEKDELGRGSYVPENHQKMCELRAKKIAGIVDDIPPAELEEGSLDDDLLVVAWGATYGAVTQAVREARAAGHRVASLHLRYLNPFPRRFEEILRSFDRILVPELNLGQLEKLIRMEYLIEVEGLHKVQGQPFRVHEIRERIEEMLGA